MDLPSFLPEAIKNRLDAHSDVELFEQLVKNTDTLTSFFSYAAEDETWALHHIPFCELVLKTLTNQYEKGRLDTLFAKRILNAVQEHFSLLSPILPRSCVVKTTHNEIRINSLLLGETSPYFHDLLRKGHATFKEEEECAPLALEYIEMGTIENLWRREKKELSSLLKLSLKWRLDALSLECQKVLARYIQADNLFEELVFSQKLGLKVLLERGIELYNTIEKSSQLDIFGLELCFKFETFDERSLAAFYRLKGLVGQLAFRGASPQNEAFIQVVQSAPKLIGIDFRETSGMSPFLKEIPKSVTSIDLARCQWLDDRALRNVLLALPQIEELSLADNTQLSFAGFAELRNLRALRVLDLSNLSQLRDAELQMILHVHPGLKLNLKGCRGL